MHSNHFGIFPLTLILFALLTSCNSVEKVLSSEDFGYKYNVAKQYFAHKKYVNTITVLENVQPFYRGTPQDDSITYLMAKSYYLDGDVLYGEHYFDELRRNFPRSKFIEEADYLTAMCNYNISPRSDLDQDYSIKAMRLFSLYIDKYPNSPMREDCEKKYKELNDKLIYKAYIAAKLYYNIGQYKAAMVSLHNCLVDYPESVYREEIMYLIAKSTYLRAVNSIESKQKERYQKTIDEYYSFIAEYPESKYRKEMDGFFSVAQKSVK